MRELPDKSVVVGAEEGSFGCVSLRFAKGNSARDDTSVKNGMKDREYFVSG